MKKFTFDGAALKPFVMIDGKVSYGVCSEKFSDGKYRFVRDEENFCDIIEITASGSGYVATRKFFNKSDSAIDLNELGFDLIGIDFGGNPKDDYFYHNENARIYMQMTFPVDYKRTAEDAANMEFDVVANNRWADPGVITDKIGQSPYQPFPAILLSNYHKKTGIVHGTLSQDVFYHNYFVKHENGKLTLTVYSSFKGIAYREVSAGETLVDEWYLGKTEHADDIGRIFEGYTEILRGRLKDGYGARDINRHSLVWDSWNDGIFRDVSEEMLLEEAKAVKRNFPNVEWFQLDDGYAVFNTIAHGLGVPYEGEAGVDKKKFPHGLKGYVDRIKELGLRPAVWIGGLCPNETKIGKERKDWFFDYSSRMTDQRPFDVSKKEVREYMLSALDKFTKDYGFEGIKHDFWSYPFEESADVLSQKTASGYEYREWWTKAMRERLPEDGYIETGCDLGSGNPFLGKYFNNHRYGIDVAEGAWENIKTNIFWGAACFSTHTGDLFVPNSDSIGLFPGLNERDAVFQTNYMMITRSMVELGGRYTRKVDAARLKMLKKATCNINNGQDVYFAKYDYRRPGATPPEIFYINSPHFSVNGADYMPIKTIAIFNTEDAPKKISFSSEDVGAPERFILTDVWSGETLEVTGAFETELLAHGSKLYSVNKTDGVQILDSNVKLEKGKNAFEVETYYAAEAEIKFNAPPSGITFDGKPVKFTEEKGTVKLDLPGKGTLKFSFGI